MLLRSTLWTCLTFCASAIVNAQSSAAAMGQENSEPPTSASASSPDDAASKDGAERASPSGDSERFALEREFERTMTGARLEGYWQMTGEGGLADKGALTEPRKESYVVSRVSKLDDDRWLIFARITFADKDVSVPVPVRVVWAGDTAIITLDDIGVPLIGTYSARVMVHKGFYSGVWYSNIKNYGGVMAGKIMREHEANRNNTKPISSSEEDG